MEKLQLQGATCKCCFSTSLISMLPQAVPDYSLVLCVLYIASNHDWLLNRTVAEPRKPYDKLAGTERRVLLYLFWWQWNMEKCGLEPGQILVTNGDWLEAVEFSLIVFFLHNVKAWPFNFFHEKAERTTCVHSNRKYSGHLLRMMLHEFVSIHSNYRLELQSSECLYSHALFPGRLFPCWGCSILNN